jgi:hypothetical protein
VATANEVVETLVIGGDEGIEIDKMANPLWPGFAVVRQTARISTTS